ncbi:MAG TPA: hypothetical protein VHP83_19120 [Aggregatilineaceae bacterium]|nr:hypothetical protein [Aggregatilineaceae bacterium]
MKLKLIVFALIAVAVLGIGYHPAQALSTNINIVPDCVSASVASAYSLTYDRDNTGAGAEAIEITITDGAGKLLYYEADTFLVGYTYNSPGGIVVGYSAAPEWNPLIVKIVSLAGNGLAEELVYHNTGTCAGLPDYPYQGAPIPAGFQLRTITCDTPVYDSPAGSPVGENRIRAGQTWYVNTTAKTAGDGSSWSEVFVAGYKNGYVPSSCVQ